MWHLSDAPLALKSGYGHARVRVTAMSKRKWRYLKPSGEQYGPVTSADLRAAAQLGFVTPEDLVQLSGTHDWIKARLIAGLFMQEQTYPAEPLPNKGDESAL